MYIEMENPSQVYCLQGVFELPGLDSNQDKENQNLLCYRYTTGYCFREVLLSCCHSSIYAASGFRHP